MPITPRYTDKFLNALMEPHHIYVEAQLWYDNKLVGPLPIVSGSVTADRAGDVRRTAQLSLDPTILKDTAIAPKLNPKGSIIKLWRGVRYPDNTVESIQIFTGRIESVQTSLSQVNVTCSDMAAFVLDARFVYPYQPYSDNQITWEIEAIIVNSYSATGGISVVIDNDDPTLVGRGITYEREPGEAINHLLKAIAREWEAEVDGVVHIRKLPAVITETTKPVWIVDSGDAGVLLDTNTSLDRQGAYNYVVVEGEPVGGDVGAYGEWMDDDENSLTWYYGPYGQMPGFYSGQTVRTTAAAEALAAELGANALAKNEQIQVTCIPNPKLKLGSVVRVFWAGRGVDKMYYVQSFEMPLDPETPMTMTLYQTLTPATPSATGMRRFKPSPLLVPEGCTWQPIQ